MSFTRYSTRLIISLGTLVCCLLLHLPSVGQSTIPLPSTSSIPEVSPQQPLIIPNLSNFLVSDWIWLDGHRLFKIAATKGNLSERIQTVQESLSIIKRNYLNTQSVDPTVEIRTLNNLPVISVGSQHLLTITALDAELRGVEVATLGDQLKTTLVMALKRSRIERQPQYLQQQGLISIGVIAVVLVCNRCIQLWQRYLSRPAKAIAASKMDVGSKLPPVQFWIGFSGLLRQVLSILRVSVGVLGLLICLDRFPYTRPINVWLFQSLSIPLTLALVGVCTFLLIRLTWALVNRFALALTVTPLLTPITSRRMLLRISTITKVIKGFAVPVWISIGVIVALIVLKVDVGPLLAGVGLIGVAISLASQSIIKDAINGFLVLLEDQFGVGDVIQVGEYTGAVETLNLRMTQIRNAEGQLITIPNSEIRIVANLSSEWSRVDLNIPIPYDANVDQTLDLIQSTAMAMAEDANWQPHIIEPPQLMGIDDFDHRGLVAKVWIKTQPLQQWAVSRELRRRLKLAFDQADIVIPVPQHSLWVQQQHS
ncbi:mechanosensitive ion channel family protein [Acaryochloris sp. IP29b_bin.148]|uniref:mechanosensitive ion channel family protein n=1 Tax=Acaryochloris sp. IP29b_bin.148 TaxID=2969218 RepID=UPI0026332E4F|nr:mechanosensitive ion channel family protein [Acaryochloris sp. IP29b_bin.148]